MNRENAPESIDIPPKGDSATAGDAEEGSEPISPTSVDENGEPLSPSRLKGRFSECTKGSPKAETGRERTHRHWLKSVQKVFGTFDKDHSGAIDVAEFGAALDSVGLHFAENDLQRLVKEFDVNGDGEIDFDEFASFLEAHGMGPGSMNGKSLGLSDAIKMINTSVKATICAIGEKEEAAIEEKATALCPKSHTLEKVSIGELNLEKFFYGYGGFVCAKCDIHSENLCNKSAFLCMTCQYVLCSMCSQTVRKEKVQAEVQKRMRSKQENLWAFSEQGRKSQQSNRDSILVNRRSRKTQMNFAAGGMRISIDKSVEGNTIEDAVEK